MTAETLQLPAARPRNLSLGRGLLIGLALLWLHADELRAHRVGGLGEIAHGGTRLGADPLRQREQA